MVLGCIFFEIMTHFFNDPEHIVWILHFDLASEWQVLKITHHSYLFLPIIAASKAIDIVFVAGIFTNVWFLLNNLLTRQGSR